MTTTTMMMMEMVQKIRDNEYDCFVKRTALEVCVHVAEGGQLTFPYLRLFCSKICPACSCHWIKKNDEFYVRVMGTAAVATASERIIVRFYERGRPAIPVEWRELKDDITHVF